MNLTVKQLKNISNTVYESVQKKQEIPVFSSVTRYQLVYALAKAVLNPTKTIVVNDIKAYSKPEWTYISRDVPKADYLKLAKYVVDYVNKDNDHRLPNYLPYKEYKISTGVYTYVFACIYKFYHMKSRYPAYWTFNNKVFTKPVETGNAVYDYVTKKYGKKFTTLDGILEYVADNFSYQGYYDDKKSNKEVTDTKSGNCTDLLQWLCNMVTPLGYEWKCIHVMCSSSVGHVRGMFRHKTNTNNEWVYRDIACVANNGDVYCNWCTSGEELLAYNPSWFLENLNR